MLSKLRSSSSLTGRATPAGSGRTSALALAGTAQERPSATSRSSLALASPSLALSPILPRRSGSSVTTAAKLPTAKNQLALKASASGLGQRMPLGTAPMPTADAMSEQLVQKPKIVIDNIAGDSS